MITLSKFKDENIKQLLSWVVDERFLFTWAGPLYKFPLTEEQIKMELKEAQRENLKMLFSILDTESNEIVGHIQLLQIDKVKKTATIGRVLVGNPDMRNKGIGLRAIQQLLDKCFNDLELEKINLVVFDFNKSAIACYKKAGFEIESVYENSREFKGESLNLILMKTIKNDSKN